MHDHQQITRHRLPAGLLTRRRRCQMESFGNVPPFAACRWECGGTQLAHQALLACIIHLQRRDDRAADVSLAVQALSAVFSVDVLSDPLLDSRFVSLRSQPMPPGGRPRTQVGPRPGARRGRRG